MKHNKSWWERHGDTAEKIAFVFGFVALVWLAILVEIAMHAMKVAR